MLAMRYIRVYACSFFLCHLPNSTFLLLQALEINFASLSLRDVKKHGAKLPFCNCQRILPSSFVIVFVFMNNTRSIGLYLKFTLLRSPVTWCRKPSIIHQLHTDPVNSNHKNIGFKKSEKVDSICPTVTVKGVVKEKL